MTKTTDQVKDKDFIFSNGTSADMDSLIFTYTQLDSDFRRFFKKLVLDAKANAYEWSSLREEANSEIGPGAQPGDLMDTHAKLLVDIIHSNGAITETTEIVDCLAPFLPVGPKCEKAKFPTMGASKRMQNIFLLPSITAAEPVHAWVITKGNMPEFRQSVVRIAWYLNWYYPTGVTMENAYKLKLPATEMGRNQATTIGGLWIFRLAFILYTYEHPSDLDIRYIEETYNMKKRSMISHVPKSCLEWSKGCDVDAVRFNMFSQNDLPNEASEEMARCLAERLCSQHTQVRAMFAFFYLGMLNGIFNLGIGVQSNAFKSDGTSMFIAQKRSMNNNIGAIGHLDYVSGGLCPGLSGFTEQLVHICEVANNSTKLQGKPVILSDATDAAKRKLHNGLACAYTHVRTQTYYPFFRYYTGGCENSYDKRISTLCKLDEKASKVVGGLKRFSTTAAERYAFFRNGGSSYRSEIAYLCNGLAAENFADSDSILAPRTKVRLFMSFTQSDKREARTLQNSLQEVLTSTISKALQNAKANIYAVEANVIANYSISVLNAYIYAYYVAIVVLNQFDEKEVALLAKEDGDNQIKDRIAICMFIRYVQDFLATFLRGCSSKEFIGKDAYNRSRFYHVQVFLYKLGKTLNRPYTVYPTIPKIIVDKLRCTVKGMEAEMAAIASAGYILTRSHVTVSSSFHARKFQKLWECGRGDQIIIKCSHPECKVKYFLSADHLHEHLAEEPLHSNGPAPAMTLTSAVFRHMYNYTLSTCTEEQQRILHSIVKEGGNNIVSGNGGTGKSVLLKKILRLLWIRENDGIPGPNHYPRKVFGIAMQLLQSKCANKSFVTAHNFMGIGVLDIPFHRDEHSRIVWAMAHLLEYPRVKGKLRACEVLIVEEVGMMPDYVGELLLTLINVARGRLKLKGNAYSNINGNQNKSNDDNPGGGGEDDDDDEADDEFGGDIHDESKLHAVQLYFNGQCTQLKPIAKELQPGDSADDMLLTHTSFACSERLLTMCICNHLITLFRNNGDKKLEELSNKARVGNFQVEDIDYIIENAGMEVKRKLGLLQGSPTSAAEYVQVTHVVYTHEELQIANMEIEKKLETIAHVRFTESFAEDSILVDTVYAAKKGFKYFEILSIPNSEDNLRESGGTLMAAQKVDKSGSKAKYAHYVKPPNDKLKGNMNLDRTLGKVGPKSFRMFNGMPVILTDTLERVAMISGGTGTLAKNTQGVISDFDLSCAKPFIIVDVKGETNNLVETKVSYKIHRTSEQCKVVIDGEWFLFRRLQFPLKTGLCISWTLVQGLTIPYLCLDFGKNSLLHGNSIISCEALWYVTLSRVKSLQCIYIQGLETFSESAKNDVTQVIYDRLKSNFFQYVDQKCIAFEAKYIEKATSLVSEKTIIKASNKIALLEHMKERFNSSKNFLSSKSELAVIYVKLADICLQLVRIIRNALRPVTIMNPFDKTRLSIHLNSDLIQGKEYADVLVKHVNPSLPLSECFQWIKDFCEGKCNVNHDDYYFSSSLITFQVGGNISDPVDKLEFRFLLRSGVANSNESPVNAAFDDDLVDPVSNVLTYIQEYAEQVKGPGNPVNNPAAFIESYASSEDDSNKRQRGSYANVALTSDSKLQTDFLTSHRERFLQYQTIREVDQMHAASNRDYSHGHDNLMNTLDDHVCAPLIPAVGQDTDVSMNELIGTHAKPCTVAQSGHETDSVVQGDSTIDNTQAEE